MKRNATLLCGLILGAQSFSPLGAESFRQIQNISANGANVTLKLYQSSDNATVEFRLTNNDPTPYNVTISVNLDNMRADHALPYRGVLAANQGTEVVAFRISRVDPNRGFFFRDLGWNLAPAAQTEAFREVHHTGVYALPWRRGRTFRIDNGFNGYGAHKGDWAYAVDFKMPVNTEVFAARAGRVTAVESRFSEGGNNPALGDKANYIYIEHEDGSTARYLHLRQNGVRLEVGATVRKGQLMGYSGNTGWSTDPHLHFDVIVPKRGGGHRTIPFEFITRKGKRIRPVVGLSLTQ